MRELHLPTKFGLTVSIATAIQNKQDRTLGISFSGLASGLDTSSWVESLTALKRAKIKTLEQEKSTVQLTKDTLDNIKSFFSSFRSMLEKVTDTRFGIASMDIFSKNLANSSNTNFLTAIATNEAAEGTYNITVDKLATQTEAVSTFKRSITETVTAGLDTKLTDIGVNINSEVGSAISINVNDTQYGIELNKDDTIATFINKLKDKGVEASYNTNTGIFSANLSKSDIIENGTNIANALHLANVNEGYKSNVVLQTTTTEEAYYKNASSDTKLTTLGVTTGDLNISSSTFTINDDTTIGSLIEDLGTKRITASFVDGRLTIEDAVIDTSNATGSSFMSALSLTQSVYSKAQTSKVLTYQENVNNVLTADGSTKLSEFGTIKNDSTVTVKNAAGEEIVINLNENSTIDDLFNELHTEAGMSGSIVNGQIQITGGTITGGTYDVVTNLKLSRTPNATSMSGNMLTTNITTTEAANGNTLLKDIGVETGTVTFETAAGNKNITINDSTTIDSFVADLNTNGITASFVDGNLSIKDAVIDTSSGKGASLISSLNLSASTNKTTQTSNALSYNATIETNYKATAGTYLRDVGDFSAGQTITLNDASGNAHTITLSSADSTIQTIIDGFEAAGMRANITNGVLEISGGTITGGTYDISNIFNLTDVTDATSTTGSVCSTDITIKHYADGDTKLSTLGVSAGNATFQTQSGDEVIAITENTTIDDLVSALDTAGIDASYNNGTFTINNTTIDTSSGIGASLVNGLGLTTFVNSSEQSSQSLSYEASINTTTAATSDTKLSAIGENPDGKTVTIEGATGETKTITLNTNSTIGNLLSEINGFDGMTASIDGNGNISVTGGTITGGTYDAAGILGLTRTADPTNMVGISLTTNVSTEHIANSDTLLSDLGITAGSYNVVLSDDSIETLYITDVYIIGDIITDLNQIGVNANIDGNGVFTISGGVLQNATSNIASKLSGTESILNSSTKSEELRYTETSNEIANLDTTLGEIFNFSGAKMVYLVNSGVDNAEDLLESYDNEMEIHDTDTVGDFISLFKDCFNIDVTYNESNGKLTVESTEPYQVSFIDDENNVVNIFNYDNANIIDSKYTSENLRVQNSEEVTATTSTVLKDGSGNMFDLRNIGLQFTASDVDSNGDPYPSPVSPVNYADVMPEGAIYTIQNILDFINNETVGTASFENGVLTITGGTISTTSGDLETTLGLTTTTNASFVTSRSAITYTGYYGYDNDSGAILGLGQTVTVGTNITSSSPVELTTIKPVANGGVKFSEIVTGKINGTITAYGVTGTVIGIGSEEDLINLRNLVNDGSIDSSGLKFIQTANIQLSSNWEGIGDSDSYFRGTYDGGGYYISGLRQDSDTETYGLFGNVYNAEIKNIRLEDVIINESTADLNYVGVAKSSIGALVTYAEGSNIHNSIVAGSIDRTVIHPSNIDEITTGGVVGYCSDSSLEDISCYVNITVNAGTTGGIVGANASGSDLTMNRLHYNGNFQNMDCNGDYNLFMGGILGSNYGITTISNALIEGSAECGPDKSGQGDYYGGVVGYNPSGTHTSIYYSVVTPSPSSVFEGSGCFQGSGISCDDVSFSYTTWEVAGCKTPSEIASLMWSQLTPWSENGWIFNYSSGTISRIDATEYDLIVTRPGPVGAEQSIVKSFNSNDTVGYLEHISDTGITGTITPSTSITLTSNSGDISAVGLWGAMGGQCTGSSSVTATVQGEQDMTWQECYNNLGLGSISGDGITLGYIKDDVEGTSQEIKASPATTLKQTLDAMANAGINYSINSDGTISFFSTGNKYFEENGRVMEYVFNSFAGTQKTNRDTTLQDLFANAGCDETGNFSITIGDLEGNETVINLDSNKTINSLISDLNTDYDINAHLTNTKLFRFSHNNEYYIKSMSADLEIALNTESGEGFTYNTISNNESITGNTKLSTLGVTDGTFIIGSGSSNTTIVVDSTESVAEFGARLEAAGYNWSIEDGKFTILDSGEHAINTAGSSNIAEKLKLYYDNWTGCGATQTSGNLTETQYTYSVPDWNTKIVDLCDSNGNNLGITTGELNVQIDGVLVNGQYSISESTTLGELREEFANRGLTLTRNTISGKLTLEGNGEITLTGNSNAKDLLFTNSSNTFQNQSNSFTESVTTSHIINEQSEIKLTDLKDTSGNSIGITTGAYYVYRNDVRTEEIIDENTTVADFIETLQGYGFTATVNSSGRISVSANGNSWLEAADGGSNIIETIFNNYQFTYQNTSNPLSYTTSAGQAITNDTLIKDITGASLTGGVFNITDANGNVEATVNVDNNTTVQDIREALGLRGFTTSLINGQLSVHSDSGKQLKSTDGGTNALSILGIETTNATSHYNTSNPITITTSTPETTGATLSTALSDLGVTQGEFYIYSNGVQNKVYVGEGETVESLLNKFTTFGVSASLVDDGGNKYIRIAGNGYCGAAASDAAGASNIVSQLFGANQITTSNGMRNNNSISYNETTTQPITADTKISDIKNSTLQAGNFNVVDGDGTTTHAVSINNSTTVGELMDTLSTLYGFDCSLAGGQLTVRSNDGKSLASIGGGTNALSILGIETNGTTKTYESTPINVVEHSNEITKATFDTELSNLGVTSGQFNVYVDGVKNITYVSEGETVGSLLNKLQGLGVQAGLVSDGVNNVIKILGNGDTRIETSPEAGASNIVSALFNPSNIVTTTKYNNSNPITYDVTTGQAVTRDTKIKDIADSSLATGNFNIVDPDGTVHAIAVDNNTTIGSLMDILSSGAYGFDTTLTSSGQLLVHSSDGKALKSIGGGTNALSILGIETTSATSTYDSTPLSYKSSNNETFKPTLDTDLSTLGITSGEFYVYSNGVKNTAYVSTGDKVRDLLDTIKTFGIQAALVEEDGNTIIKLNGDGDSYVAASEAVTGQKSNVVQTLFTNPATEVYSYSGIPQELVPENIVVNKATSESLIGDIAKAAGLNANAADGIIKVNVNGVESSINIASTDTVEDVLGRFRQLGLEATIGDGEITIASGYNTLSIDQANSTSLFGKSGNSLSLAYNENLGGYTQSNATIDHEVTRIDDISVSNYANKNTKLSLLNISDGSLTIYRDGEKNILEINSDWTLKELQDAINLKFGDNGDIVINFDDENSGIIKNGFLEFSSTSGARVEIGSTTDKSNFSSITGVQSQDDGTVRSARELYCVTSSSKVTQEGLFRGLNNIGEESSVTVTAGTFRVGDAEFTIDENTTIADIASMINNSNDAQATAWWDNITGQFFIRAKSTGASFINIEAGTSNFTDVMGLTKDGRMVVDSQTIGNNAKFTINGTSYTSTSNTVDSSVLRIQGVTLSLKGMSEGSSVTLTIEKDKESVANAIGDVVDAYNELMNNVDKQIATTGKLNKETTLKSLRNQLRNLMTGSVDSSPYTTLSKLGIRFASAAAGNINTDNASINNFTFDKDEFLKAYATDPSAVKALLVGDDVNKGIFTQVEDLVENALKGVTGYFDTAAKSYTNKITNLETKITNQNSYLERYKSRLETKFKSMDMLISKMNDQYRSFLAA